MFFDDIKLGMTVDIAPAVIEKEKMLDFARLYDNIPLHTDEEYAKTTPFGGLIAPGVMSFMAVWAKYLEVDFFGEELLAGRSTKIEWLKPVFAGDVLTGKATVTALTPRNPRNGLVEIRIEASNQKGELVLTDITEAVVKRRTEEEK
ncbi:MAG: MaoC family dehydratase N-terminal domain-containing protein [Clostridia bacterium]|nr:MaoC family dehydratase N-terminal domain-containing protein [Clostridia bacterium]